MLFCTSNTKELFKRASENLKGSLLVSEAKAFLLGGGGKLDDDDGTPRQKTFFYKIQENFSQSL